MAAFNGNNAYVNINGYDVCPVFAKMELSKGVESEDLTAGCGQTDVQRGTKLRDRTGKLTVVYDTGRVHEYIAKIGEDEAFIIYGPEGAISGKPRHAQKFIITKVDGPKQNVEKTKVVFDLDIEQADAPQDDLYAGATFA